METLRDRLISRSLKFVEIHFTMEMKAPELRETTAVRRRRRVLGRPRGLEGQKLAGALPAPGAPLSQGTSLRSKSTVYKRWSSWAF